ncbi:MAG: hypothetical protein ABIP19_01070 [Dermatophilaceae bacterium]
MPSDVVQVQRVEAEVEILLQPLRVRCVLNVREELPGVDLLV